MQRSVAWISAAIMLALAVWIVWAMDDPSKRPVVAATSRASQGQQVAPRPRQPQQAEAGEDEFVRRVLPPRDADSAGSGASSATDPSAGGSGTASGGVDRERSRPEGSSGQATATADATDTSMLRPGEADDGADGENDPAFRDKQKEAAEMAEDLDIYTPQELEARIQREMKRSGSDYETAKQKVLAEGLAWDELARGKLGPDASPIERRTWIDAAKTYGPQLSPDRMGELWDQRLNL